jgi:AcrR family transcriptional regulator
MTPPRPAVDVRALRENLLDHAEAIVRRDGVAGLTMRALAAEAGSAVGLSYKAFTSREELLGELARRAIDDLSSRPDDWAARPAGALDERLLEFADIVLASHAPGLVAQVPGGTDEDGVLDDAFATGAARRWDHVLAAHLGVRQRRGEVASDVDVDAYGFMIAGALHNLVVAGDASPRPDRSTLAHHLSAVARHLEGRTVDGTAISASLPASGASVV